MILPRGSCWVALLLLNTAGAEQYTTPPCLGYTMAVKPVSVSRRSRACFAWLSSKKLDGWIEHLGKIVLVPVPILMALAATNKFIKQVR